MKWRCVRGLICSSWIVASGCSLPQMYDDWHGVAGNAARAASSSQGGAFTNHDSLGGATGGSVTISGSSGQSRAGSTSMGVGGEAGANYGGSCAGMVGSIGDAGARATAGTAGAVSSGGIAGTDSTVGTAGTVGNGGIAGAAVFSGAAGMLNNGGIAGTSSTVATGGTASVTNTGGASGASSTLGPKLDVELVRSYPPTTYKEVVASSTQLFLLKTNGSTEVRDVAKPDVVLVESGTNFTALDYVKGWNLIATRDPEGFRGVFIDAFGGVNNVVCGEYPPNMTMIEEVAAFEPEDPIRQLRVCVIGHQVGTPLVLQCGTHVPGASPAIQWDNDTYPTLPHVRGLSAMFENGTGYLVQFQYHPQPRFIRFAAPNGTIEVERLGDYTEHVYLNPNIVGSLDRFAPVGFDYSEEWKEFFAIDDFWDRENGVWRQSLVKLSRTNVSF